MSEAYAEMGLKRRLGKPKFEFAERGGLSSKTYAWGDEFRP